MCCMRGCAGCATYARVKALRRTYILSEIRIGGRIEFVLWEFKHCPFRPMPKNIVTVSYTQSKLEIMYAASKVTRQ